MLVLGRAEGDRIVINADGTRILLTVLEVHRGRIRLGFEAPANVSIMRAELVEDPPEQKGKPDEQ